MQKTNFRYVAIVHDDCSKDKSAGIIREYAERYPEIIKPIYETENQWSKQDGSLERVLFNAIDATKTKYVAMCEGDDFWTDPYKLQKQVDILNADESLMGCVTNVSVVDNYSNIIEKKRSIEVVKGNISGKYTLRDFFARSHQYPTLTMVYRCEHVNDVRSKFFYMQNQWLGDWTLWIALHIYGDVYYLDEITGAYRVNPSSLTHTAKRVERAKASREICRKVADILPEEYSDVAKNIRKTRWTWIPLMFAYKAEKRYVPMIGCAIIALFATPVAFMNVFKQARKKNLKANV
jgi:glycosyltransferase involved in cell wall biosynthesis